MTILIMGKLGQVKIKWFVPQIHRMDHYNGDSASQSRCGIKKASQHTGIFLRITYLAPTGRPKNT